MTTGRVLRDVQIKSGDASSLGDVINDAHVQSRSDFTDFVYSGLRAASSCRRLTRSAILADVAAVLACRPDELNFLFSDGSEVFPVESSVAVNAPTSDDLRVPEFRDMLMGLAAE